MKDDIVWNNLPRGATQLGTAIRNSLDTDSLVHELGIYSLSHLIEKVLDEHYPADVFGNGDLVVELSWAQGRRDIDPGVRWVALLRLALKQLPR